MNIKYAPQIVMIFLLFHNFVSIQAIPLINKIVLKNNTITIRPNRLFKKKYLSENFFASYRKEDVDLSKLDKAVLITPFLMNVIPIIWLSGQTWEVDEIDEKLFKSLQLIKKNLAYLYPKAAWNGQLKVGSLVRTRLEPTKSNTFAMPFSGGVDSVHTSISHANAHQILITAKEHPGFLNDVQWTNVIKNTTRFAQQFGHENAFVDSNYQRFIKDRKVFSNTPDFSGATSHGLGWFGIALPILIAKKCGNFKIAGSIDWTYPLPTLLCPMVDNMIEFANITVTHDGFDCTRPDKVDEISIFFKEKKHEFTLYVCQRNKDGINCCACEKCIRTICSLLAIGQTSFENYGFKIDLEQAQSLIQNEAVKWANVKYWRLEALQKKIKEKKLEKSDYFYQCLSNVAIPKKKHNFSYHDFALFATELKKTVSFTQDKLMV